MILTIMNVVYVLLAIAMVGFILVQRGAGAQAGSGFGAGASGTVFGARGASNFLTKSTRYLAIMFFIVALGMGAYIVHGGVKSQAALGVMGVSDKAETKPDPNKAKPAPASTAPDVPKPVAPTSSPTNNATTGDKPDVPAPAAQQSGALPAIPAANAPATAAPATEPAAATTEQKPVAADKK